MKNNSDLEIFIGGSLKGKQKMLSAQYLKVLFTKEAIYHFQKLSPFVVRVK